MPIRITGMNSGLDTESIITELVKAKSVKKDELVKAQTKLEWKQDAWKELNAKVYNLYSKTLSNLRLESDYTKKTTKVSNSNAATVITGSTAVNGVQTLKINKLAKTGYLTGAELKKDNKKADYTSATKLKDIVGEAGVGSELELKVGDKTTKITIDENTSINDFVSTLKKAGLNASFDEKNQRFFISAKESGAAADFSLTAKDAKGMGAMQMMGIVAPLADDDATRNSYMQYCVENVDGSGKKQYAAMTDLSAIVSKEKEDRIEQDKRARAELVEITEQINSLKTKEGNEDLSSVNLDDLKKELEQKEKELKNASSDKQDEIQKEIDALNAKIIDKEKLNKLEETEASLNAVISDNEKYFTIDKNGEYQEKMDGDQSVLAKAVKEKADFAAKVLNGGFISSGATRIAGQDSEISLNGAIFTSEGNTFEINGLTITAHAETEEEFTLTTADDTDGIYDMIKNFLKEYNELINEMDKLYNADSAKGYEPLTDEEKEAMSEKEAEKWEEKIKNSILRKDSTLNSVASAMKQVMSQGITMGNGSKMYLSDFGIGTLGYFSAKDNEKNAYHIDGDPDDASTMTNTDKLKAMIATDPDNVVEFFSSLSKSLYNKIGDMMKKTEYSSSFTLYDDVAMKDEYNDYKSKISKQEQKITDYEDRYYKKFSAMETALAKLQSKESAISGLFNI